ncbi:MAG: hypothetical protein EOM56_13170 [Deltaproteobacteria bacterium]|nr:hypothetical protein [Deltaproteobacteria bacterium]
MCTDYNGYVEGPKQKWGFMAPGMAIVKLRSEDSDAVVSFSPQELAELNALPIQSTCPLCFATERLEAACLDCSFAACTDCRIAEGMKLNRWHTRFHAAALQFWAAGSD